MELQPILDAVSLFARWTLNGFLAIIWLAVDNWLSLALIPPLALLVRNAPREQRGWTAAACLLAFGAAVISPQVVALLTLLMAVAGLGAARLEQFSRTDVCWSAARMLALYALTALGFWAWRVYSLGLSDPLLAAGQNYLTTIGVIGLFLVPLGFLGYLAQKLWVHPPLPDSPERLIAGIRGRGKT